MRSFAKKILLICFVFIGSGFADKDRQVDFLVCEAANNKKGIRVFQGQDGWLFHPGDLATNLEISDDALPYLARLNRALEQQGVRLLIANLPTRGMLHHNKFDNNQPFFKSYNNSLANYSFLKVNLVLNSVGILTPNLLQPFKNQGKPYNYSFTRDSHWSPSGSRVVAQEISRVIKALPEYKLIASQQFKTHTGDIKNRRTDLAYYVRKVCGNVKIPPEPEQVYKTIPVGNVVQDRDLFGDKLIPEIVLIGTSNSANNQVNFWGFLQDFLDIEILNVSIPAGGTWTAIKDYFLKTKPTDYPRVAIWEFPYGIVFQLNKLQPYRELIPSIYGICDQSLITNQVRITHNNLSGNLINFPNSLEKSPWRSVQAKIDPNQATSPNGQKDADKMVFSGLKPRLLYRYQTHKPLASKTFRQRIWLWTDKSQPTQVKLHLYAHPNLKDLKSINIELNNEPTLYELSHTFRQAQKNTSLVMRVDGSPKGEQNYLYAWNAQLYEDNPLQVITNSKSLPIKGSDYYLAMEFSDLSILDFGIRIKHADEQIEIFNIQRSTRVNNSGKFFLELSPNIKSNLKEISLNLPTNSTGTLKTYICQAPNVLLLKSEF